MIKKKLPAILLILLSSYITSYSQQKKLDISALSRPGGNPGFLNPPVSMIRWTDDSHFIVTRQFHPDSARRTFIVDVKTGVETVSPPVDIRATASKKVVARENDLFYTNNGTSEQLTNTKEREVNPTFSPDSNYIAFTRNNNLYTINLSTKKETQLTTDGSDIILNGYSSWVYMEEILGRGTAYRAFWWSPDSRKIAFFRSDDSKVPVFTITDGTGQHGYAETQRYPKAGDPNPEVKVGIAYRDGGTVTWADFNEKDDQYFGEPIWRPA
jgi:dipeptidyl-peptidase-4